MEKDETAEKAIARPSGSVQEASGPEECAGCHKSLTLLDEHEWPDDMALVFCSSCSIDEIQRLREVEQRLQAEIARLREENAQLQAELGSMAAGRRNANARADAAEAQVAALSHPSRAQAEGQQETDHSCAGLAAVANDTTVVHADQLSHAATMLSAERAAVYLERLRAEYQQRSLDESLGSFRQVEALAIMCSLEHALVLLARPRCVVCSQVFDRCHHCDQGQGLLGDRVLLELKRIALTDMADGLEQYVVDHGAEHDDDCPCDDTCDCSYKSMNDAVNSACRLIRAMAIGSGTTPLSEASASPHRSAAPESCSSSSSSASEEPRS